MKKTAAIGILLLAAVVPAALMMTHPASARADNTAPAPNWFPAAWQSALQAPHLLVNKIIIPQTPAVIPQSQALADTFGKIASYQPNGPTTTSANGFFKSLGSNGRTCFSCHQPQDGWAITPATIKNLYNASAGLDPVFAPVDGADCPSLPGATSTDPTKFVAARGQLFSKANFRIPLGLPTNPEWTVTILSDPTHCENSTTYGLPAKILSVYRRPLPATNLAFLDPDGLNFLPFGPSPEGTPFAIMWDSREPDLQHQFIDATATHAQATPQQLAQVTLTSAPVQQGVAFQTNIYTAQTYRNNGANDLTGADGSGATGGPFVLANLTVPLVNLILSPGEEFTFYNPWLSLTGTDATSQARASIARGQEIFNTRQFFTSGVAGLNDPFIVGDNFPTTCQTCHNAQGVGNNSALGPLHTGIGDNSSNALPPTPDMPLFAFTCPAGSILDFSNPDGQGHDIFITTDPGLGLITGQCADLGKMKTPVLRGLASRAPYFHGGNAATLVDLVNFYNTRFNIGLSAQDKNDLVNFLLSL